MYDVVIVGAGISGIITAYTIASKNSNISILLIDKGGDILERKCLKIGSSCIDCDVCNIAHGFGGAGMLSDGKLCFSNVGSRTDFISADKRNKQMEKIAELLDVEIPKNESFDSFKNSFKESDLDLKCYPVLRLNVEDRYSKVIKIKRTLEEMKVEIKLHTEIKDVVKSSDGTFKIESSNGCIKSKKVVLAVGKIGSPWIRGLCDKFKIETFKMPLYVGVRMEMPILVTGDILKISANPKIFTTKGQYMKTHCFSENGKSIPVNYNGIHIIDGDFNENEKTGNTSVNIVAKIEDSNINDSYSFSECFVRMFSGKLPCKVLLGDFLKKDGMIKLFPMEFRENFENFINKINNVLNGFSDNRNFVYLPFIEWWNKKILTDSNFETKIKNLYVIGDGNGLSQGIISAGIQGISCGEKIVNSYVRP